MSNEIPDHEGAGPSEQSRPTGPGRASEEEALGQELPRFPEAVRQAILESEARILARWKKRGLFGLTTSTG